MSVDVRLMATKGGEYVVIVKGNSGTLIVLTPEEAVGIANRLLDVAQSIKQKEEDDNT
jgi:hypothetical protein